MTSDLPLLAMLNVAEALLSEITMLCWWCSLSMLQAQCELWSGHMPLLQGSLVSMDDAALNGSSVEEQKAKLGMFYETVTHAGGHCFAVMPHAVQPGQ